MLDDDVVLRESGVAHFQWTLGPSTGPAPVAVPVAAPTASRPRNARAATALAACYQGRPGPLGRGGHLAAGAWTGNHREKCGWGGPGTSRGGARAPLCVEGRLQGEGKNWATQVPVHGGGCFRQTIPATLLRPEAPEYLSLIHHRLHLCFWFLLVLFLRRRRLP